MAQFDRVARLTIGQAGADGIIIEKLRIVFEIEKDPTEETNKSSIRVYNLAPETWKKIEQWVDNDGGLCILEAGYAEDIGLVRIFAGYITYVTSTKDGPDLVTEMELADGQLPIRDTVVSLGYGTGIDGRRIAQDVAAQMGLVLRVGPDAEFVSYPNGFAFAGYARHALTKICEASGLEWSVQNNELQIIAGGGSTGVRALVFSADSGLIGSPERIIKSPDKANKTKKKKTSKKKEKPEKQAGWKIRALLAPTATPCDAARVESMTVTGWFKMESVKHVGDTHGDKWHSEIELIEVMLD